MNIKHIVCRIVKERSPALYFILFIAVLAVIAVIFHFITGNMFLEAMNVRAIVSNAIYPTFIAWGLCFMFACGYTDLSVGSVVILGSFATGAFGNIYGYMGVLLGGLVVATVLILFNFVVFAFTRIPSWIASISLAMIYEALAVFLRANRATRPYIDAELSREFRALGQIPLNVILLVACFALVYLVYNKTSIGVNIRAIGGSKHVSQALGINVLRTLLWVGLICGLLVGAASVFQQSYNVRTTVMPGLTSIQIIFKPLSIVFLAQILQKRINIIIAVPFCSLIIYGVFNAMAFLGVPSGTLQDVVLCIFLIVFGVGGQRGVKEVVK